MVHDGLLDAEHLAPFKTLVLPNVEALSDAQCAQLAAFVRGGGGLVATRETSLRDESGVPRKDFGLAELFGVSFSGRRPGPVRNSYLRLEHAAAPGHPLLRGLEDAPRIIHGVWQLEVAPRRAFPSGAAHARPVLPDLPMEKVYVREERRDLAAGVRARGGRGPRRLLPLGPRSHVLGSTLAGSPRAAAQRGAVGNERGGARRASRAGAWST